MPIVNFVHKIIDYKSLPVCNKVFKLLLINLCINGVTSTKGLKSWLPIIDDHHRTVFHYKDESIISCHLYFFVISVVWHTTIAYLFLPLMLSLHFFTKFEIGVGTLYKLPSSVLRCPHSLFHTLSIYIYSLIYIFSIFHSLYLFPSLTFPQQSVTFTAKYRIASVSMVTVKFIRSKILW